MNRIEYNQYVHKVEKLFQGNPKGLAKKAFHYVFLSYLYLAGVIICALGLLVGLFYLATRGNTVGVAIYVIVFVGIAILGFVWSIIKGLRVSTPPPPGIRLKKKEVPELYALLDDLKKNVARAKFDRVVINGEFNAGIYQLPRLGVFGWYKNYLVLGLPLMQTLSADEFKAVLAHEFSHLSNKDGSVGNSIYRIRRSWEQIMANLFEAGSKASWALVPFVNWFWPRFNGHAFVLSRENEYRADAAAVAFAGKDAVASSLQKTEQYGRLIEQQVWTEIYERASDVETPPDNPYNEIKSAVQSEMDLLDATEWLTQSFSRPTDYSDTHPSLRDRLSAVDALPVEVVNGATPVAMKPSVVSSAIAFLGADREAKLVAELNKDWKESLIELWKLRHEDVQEIRKELGDEKDVANAEDAWKWASAMLELKGAEEAMPWIERTLEYDPDHQAAIFSRGCYLLDKRDRSGVALLKRVSEERPDFGMDALEMLKVYYSNIGDQKSFEEIDLLADQFDEKIEKGQLERNSITKNDTYLDHELSPEALAKVTKEMAEFSYLSQIYIVRKAVNVFPKSPMYVVYVVPQAVSFDKDAVCGTVAESLAPHLEGMFFVFIKKDNKAVAKIVEEMPGSLVYSQN